MSKGRWHKLMNYRTINAQLDWALEMRYWYTWLKGWLHPTTRYWDDEAYRLSVIATAIDIKPSADGLGYVYSYTDNRKETKELRNKNHYKLIPYNEFYAGRELFQQLSLFPEAA